ncbi:MAG: F0F1 ATP synthase subunit A [Planctomycetes bacterium]|nr:F0F1 ATP synthase subunit A [Planctomycetota bacterium]
MIPTTLAAGDLISHVLPHEIFHLGPVAVSNHMIMATIAALLTFLVLAHAAARIKTGQTGSTDDYLTNGKLSQIVEVILVFLREEMTRPALGKLTETYIGYIWTTFFFILFCNLLGMFPLGSLLALFNEHWEHLGGTATGNIAVTIVLALISFFMILFVGLREHGLKYFAHFAPVPLWPFMKDASPGLMPVAILLVILEIVGAFIKPFALCMRLFANMLAGHLVLGAIIGMIFLAESYTVRGAIVAPAVLGGVIMSLLELFVAFLQAYVFTFLTVLFIAQGAVHDHGDHPHHEDHHEHVPFEHAAETETDTTIIATL